MNKTQLTKILEKGGLEKSLIARSSRVAGWSNNSRGFEITPEKTDEMFEVKVWSKTLNKMITRKRCKMVPTGGLFIEFNNSTRGNQTPEESKAERETGLHNIKVVLQENGIPFRIAEFNSEVIVVNK